MSDRNGNDPVDPGLERRITAAFSALATTEVPASAPRPGHAPRPVARTPSYRRRRWGIAGGSLLVAAAAVVLALLLGTEVFDARVAPTAPPATGRTSAPPVTTASATTPAPSTTPPPTHAATTTAPAVAPSTNVPSAASDPTAPATSSGGGPVPCSAADTGVQVGGDNGGDSHVSLLVHVTNTSATPCVTTGYPGIALLDGRGRQIVQAQRTPRGYWGGAEPATVTLAPGAEATAIVEGLSFDPATGDVCATRAAGLAVTVPDDTRSVAVAHPSGLCGQVEVHPLVAGDTGNVSG